MTLNTYYKECSPNNSEKILHHIHVSSTCRYVCPVLSLLVFWTCAKKSLNTFVHLLVCSYVHTYNLLGDE